MLSDLNFCKNHSDSIVWKGSEGLEYMQEKQVVVLVGMMQLGLWWC